MVSFIENLSQIFIASSGYFSHSFSKMKWRGSKWVLCPVSQCGPYSLLLLGRSFSPCLLPPQPGVQGCCGLEGVGMQMATTSRARFWLMSHNMTVAVNPVPTRTGASVTWKTMAVLRHLCQRSKPSHQCRSCRHLDCPKPGKDNLHCLNYCPTQRVRKQHSHVQVFTNYTLQLYVICWF